MWCRHKLFLKLMRFFLFFCAGAIFIYVFVCKEAAAEQNWGLFSIFLILLVILLFYWVFERSAATSREIAVIAVLSSIAGIARLPFAALPNVQPTTFLIIISGFVFGPRVGFMVGTTALVVSNFFLGHGPWTPWQMLAWGLAGSSAGLMGILHPRLGHKGMTIFNFLWGYLFGWIMNLWFWLSFVYPLNPKTFLLACLASFWLDTLHALGNAVFYILLGRDIVKVLTRFRQKMEISFLLPAK